MAETPRNQAYYAAEQLLSSEDPVGVVSNFIGNASKVAEHLSGESSWVTECWASAEARLAAELPPAEMALVEAEINLTAEAFQSAEKFHAAESASRSRASRRFRDTKARPSAASPPQANHRMAPHDRERAA